MNYLFSTFLLLTLLLNISFAQTHLGSAAFSGDSPTGLSGITLGAWKASSSGSDLPSIAVGNPNAKMNIGISNAVGDWSAFSKQGDVVFKLQGLTNSNILFNLSTSGSSSNGSRKFYFGDESIQKILVISNNNKVGINTDNFPSNDPDFKLYVKGGIKAEEIKVELCSGWCDYVFYPSYRLMPLSEVKTFIEAYKHLPNIPSTATLEKEGGFELGKMTTLQQEKIEELFLYVIQLDEKIKKLEKENLELKIILANQK